MPNIFCVFKANGLANKGTSLKAVIYLLASLSLLCSTIVNAALLNLVPESVEAPAWTILDTQSGQVIAEHNSHVQRAPASMTKMMVAYIALKEIEAGRLKKDEIITATPVVKMVQNQTLQFLYYRFFQYLAAYVVRSWRVCLKPQTHVECHSPQN